MLLKIQRLSHAFTGPSGRIDVLKDVDLKVDEGEFVSIMGKSGSGKSTLLMCIGGLMHPDQGCIELKGEAISKLNAEEAAKIRADKIGFVFQKFHLLPYLNIMDNIMLSGMAKNIPELLAKAEKLASSLGLSPRLAHRPHELSVGECQRVALARAMISSPELLMADEPTGNLDAENSELIIQAFEDYCAQGASVLMVTHSRESSSRCHKVFQLQDGSLHEGVV